MAHGRIQIQAQFEAKAISRPIGSWSFGGAKNVLQQLTWGWALGEAERAERVGETKTVLYGALREERVNYQPASQPAYLPCTMVPTFRTAGDGSRLELVILLVSAE